MNGAATTLAPLVALAIASSALSGCGAAAPATQKEPAVSDTTTAQPAAIAKRIGITRCRPPRRVDYAEEIAGRDDAARLTLVMSDADWTSLQASLPLTAPDQGTVFARGEFPSRAGRGGMDASPGGRADHDPIAMARECGGTERRRRAGGCRSHPRFHLLAPALNLVETPDRVHRPAG